MTATKPAVLQQLQAGLEAHRLGRLAEAERSYRAVLAAAPDALDAYNLLGRLLVQSGRAGEAAPLLRQAIERAPDQVALWLSYAEALLAGGQIGLAREAAEAVRRLAPQDENALFLWAEAQRFAQAWEMASTGYRQVIELHPEHVAAWLQLATCLQALRDLSGALAAAKQAVSLAPQAPECHNNLGNLLAAHGEHQEALRAFDTALALRPDYPAALVNKATSLREVGQIEQALPLAELAVQRSHGHPDSWAALGQARHMLGQLAPALAAYREALARRPQDAETQWNFALAALAKGDFEAGWPAFAWRWRKAAPPLPRRSWPWPQWQADRATDGRRLLLWGEQGLGDRLLFLQYLPPLASNAAQITLETDRRLIPLLQRSFPQLEFVAEEAEADPFLLAAAFDGHLSLGDLASGDPPGVAYLKPDRNRAARLRARYQSGGRNVLVGLSWRSANPAMGAAKSLEPADLAALADVEGCHFVCLQYGATNEEHAALRALLGDRYIIDPEIDPRTDLDGLAAQIAALDLVVTVSNVTAHLAGALGQQVWVLAPTGKSLFFYLMADGETTPWYPSMRIFRSPVPGHWKVPLQAVAKRLESLAK